MPKWYMYTLTFNVIHHYDVYRVSDSCGRVYYSAEPQRRFYNKHIAESEALLKSKLFRAFNGAEVRQYKVRGR